MMIPFLVDYYLLSSVLFVFVSVAVFVQKNPAKRVLLIRGVFVAIFLLPLILMMPGRQIVS